MKDRLKKKLKAKKLKEENKPKNISPLVSKPRDEINELLNEIEKKEYPPDDEYFELKAELDGWVEWRDNITKEMKYFPAPEQAMKRLQIAELDNKIEKAKKHLKEFHEADQRVQRADEKIELSQKGMDEAFERADRAHEKLYIIIKHTKPHLFKGFRQISVDSFTPEELKEFEERIAHLEATQLEEILAGKR